MIVLARPGFSPVSSAESRTAGTLSGVSQLTLANRRQLASKGFFLPPLDKPPSAPIIRGMPPVDSNLHYVVYAACYAPPFFSSPDLPAACRQARIIAALAGSATVVYQGDTVRIYQRMPSCPTPSSTPW